MCYGINYQTNLNVNLSDNATSNSICRVFFYTALLFPTHLRICKSSGHCSIFCLCVNNWHLEYKLIRVGRSWTRICTYGHNTKKEQSWRQDHKKVLKRKGYSSNYVIKCVLLLSILMSCVHWNIMLQIYELLFCSKLKSIESKKRVPI